MTYERQSFTNYHSIHPRPVDLGANYFSTIVGYGDLSLRINVSGTEKDCILKNVQHVPNLCYQLLSVSTMAKLGIAAEFNHTGAVLRRNYYLEVLATGTVTGSGLYRLDTPDC